MCYNKNNIRYKEKVKMENIVIDLINSIFSVMKCLKN